MHAHQTHDTHTKQQAGGLFLKYGCDAKDGMTVDYYADAACTDKVMSGEGWGIPYTYGGYADTCVYEPYQWVHYEVSCA